MEALRTRGESATDPDEKTVRGLYSAFNSRQLDDISIHLTEDVVWTVGGIGEGGAKLAGRTAVIDYLSRLAGSANGTLLNEVHDVIASPEHVVALTAIVADDGPTGFWAKEVAVYHMAEGAVAKAYFCYEDASALDTYVLPAVKP